MWFFVLSFLFIFGAIGVLCYKHGFTKTWGIVTALVGAVVAAVAAFWDQLVGAVPPV